MQIKIEYNNGRTFISIVTGEKTYLTESYSRPANAVRRINELMLKMRQGMLSRYVSVFSHGQ